MIDHLGIRVSDLVVAKRFYDAALAPLGMRALVELTREQTGGDAAVGYGSTRPDFWIGTHDVRGPVHVAFAAQSKADVDAFYAAAIGAGGRDNGAPGSRPHYSASYYGAFVFDPDGNNVEAVFRG